MERKYRVTLTSDEMKLLRRTIFTYMGELTSSSIQFKTDKIMVEKLRELFYVLEEEREDV